MYLALFLVPMVLMYALSTMALNHHHFVRGLYGGERPPFKKERELDYLRIFPAGATPQTMARLTESVPGRPPGRARNAPAPSPSHARSGWA